MRTLMDIKWGICGAVRHHHAHMSAHSEDAGFDDSCSRYMADLYYVRIPKGAATVYECVRAARTIKVHVCGCSVCANKPQVHCVLRAASRQELRCRCRVAALPPDCSRQFICIYGVRNTEYGVLNSWASQHQDQDSRSCGATTDGRGKKAKRELELNE
ncbi:hypothetical protein CI102_9538 [Trichoderma harzianum]|uniref:Uncharacterized protein n=1 Tax=Trichoderma harzianum CBS 226.95 TaxID=983964 RepID=A0A2T4ADR1_TRIHA|nr:hypothetical protein M431DRAFT_436752 [Trichoderma harzianum CBS 226.95]PKK44998.1 hypothetical protein CI102_9538 [Trichoderma harzianum]PTB55058.1 hypothetical protein M431DRAFT_436752 [Trichoderma harzianum CBS 226.95]